MAVCNYYLLVSQLKCLGNLRFVILQKCIIVWELRVVGWEVSYNAEFKPDAKDAYTVIIHKATKMSPTDEPVVSNTFKVGELGKLLLTIDNPTLKKKRLLYRFKIQPYSDWEKIIYSLSGDFGFKSKKYAFRHLFSPFFIYRL